MREADSEKPTVLVVDDSRLMRVAARKILKNEFEIVDAEDGDIAWEKLQNDARITLVMSDLSMPNVGGLELLNMIRHSDDPRIMELPVIIVTGAEDDDGSKHTALSAGATDFITKPFESVQLLARTKALAKQQRTHQALRESEFSRQRLVTQHQLDPLTGLANRSAFVRSVEEHLAYAIRHRTELALLLVRLEKFKILYLRRGKQDAEGLLCRIASLLQANRRREDSIARLDLDTFAILMPSSNQIGANRVGEQLKDRFADEDLGGDGGSPAVRISIGVPSCEIRRDLTAEQLIEDAMRAFNPVKRAMAQPPAGSPRASATPSTTRPQPHTAPPADVHQALQLLLNGSRPPQPVEPLARAILPLLELWNASSGSRYDALIEALHSALEVSGTAPGTQQQATKPSRH